MLLNPQRFLRSVGVFCLAQVGMIRLHNSLLEVHPGQAGLHPALDWRSQGYSPADVALVLHGLGPAGRQRYALLLLLDLAVYMWSYAALLSTLLAAAASASPVRALRHVRLLPWLAVAADAAENCLLLALVARWPGLVDALAPLVVLASRAKWQLLYASVCAVGGSGLYLIFVAGRGATRQQQLQQGSQQRKQLEQQQGKQQGKQPPQQQQQQGKQQQRKKGRR